MLEMLWVGGPYDFSVSPSPFGLDFGTSDSGLTILCPGIEARPRCVGVQLLLPQKDEHYQQGQHTHCERGGARSWERCDLPGDQGDRE